MVFPQVRFSMVYKGCLLVGYYAKIVRIPSSLTIPPTISLLLTPGFGKPGVNDETTIPEVRVELEQEHLHQQR